MLLGTIAFSLLCFSFRVSLKKYYFEGDAQGTTYHITYYAPTQRIGQKSIDSALAVIDRSMSIYRSNSIISKFNNSAKGCVVDRHLQLVVKRSLEIWKSTNGISDITVFPAVQAWGFGAKHTASLPDSAAINALLPCIGSGKLTLRGNRLLKSNPCVKIDVNGIAQGYSVDVIARLLENHRIKNYIVEIGGEIRTGGAKPDGDFVIGIEGPPANYLDEAVVRKSVKIINGAITTSGNYRKYIDNGKKRLSHLIDPKTGYPFQNEMISVTVRAKDAITADGYDNALMGMGLKRSFAFLKKHPELQAYFIYHKADSTIADTASAGFMKP